MYSPRSSPSGWVYAVNAWCVLKLGTRLRSASDQVPTALSRLRCQQSLSFSAGHGSARSINNLDISQTRQLFHRDFGQRLAMCETFELSHILIARSHLPSTCAFSYISHIRKSRARAELLVLLAREGATQLCLQRHVTLDIMNLPSVQQSPRQSWHQSHCQRLSTVRQ